MNRPEIKKVFTPRSAKVNQAMYVDRPIHENDLIEALGKTKYPILFGYSGTGKTWLYKKVLKDLSAEFRIVNCGNAARFDSLTNEIHRAVIPKNQKSLESLSTELSAGLSAPILGGGGKSIRKYAIPEEDRLLSSFKCLRKKARRKMAVLVVDNLEFLFGKDKLMEELASIITLNDDTVYATYDIRLLIVGTPSDVHDYFARIPTLSSVANRIEELKEIAGFDLSKVGKIINKGFVDLLKVNITPEDLARFKHHVHKITLGFPQMVHEYCEIFANRLRGNNWKWDNRLHSKSDLDWLRSSLRSSYAAIESLMSEKSGRRNQVLYILGRMNVYCVSPKQVEKKLREEFPNSTLNKKLNIGSILAQLTQTKFAILKSGKKDKEFEFANPKSLMCLRSILKKDSVKERVDKLAFKV